MSRKVRLREARARTDRGQLVARLSGMHGVSQRSLEEMLSELAEAGLIDLGSIPAGAPRAVKPRAGHSVSKVVREMRN